MPRSEWLKEYYSRIMEEYKFSMERKDRVLDWSIGIFFVAIVAYVELLRYQLPSFWRICLIVGLLCFIIRLFSGSCLAYAYLKKWRYLLDSIEKHWMTNDVSLDFVRNQIKQYHHTPATTERRTYFVKHQLVGGFVLLFLFPILLLLYEIYSNPQDTNTIAPITFLVAYCVYESIIFVRNRELSMPSKNATTTPNETGQVNFEKKRKDLDSLFQIALVLLGILSASEFQYFLVVEKEAMYFYALKVFTVPFIVLIIAWLAKELIRAVGGDFPIPHIEMLITEFCWYLWSFTLFYYLLGIYGGFLIGIVLSLVLSTAMSLSIQWTYAKASPVTSGDRSMFRYYKSLFWIGIRAVVFVGAYFILVGVTLP